MAFNSFNSLCSHEEVSGLDCHWQRAQVEAYAQQGNLVVAGYYHANEHCDDNELGPAAKRLADRVQANFPRAQVLVLDNHTLPKLVHSNNHASSKPSPPPIPFRLYTKPSPGGNWAREDSKMELNDESDTLVASRLLAEGRHKDIRDFEDHLEDISCDWLNQSLEPFL